MVTRYKTKKNKGSICELCHNSRDPLVTVLVRAKVGFERHQIQSLTQMVLPKEALILQFLAQFHGQLGYNDEKVPNQKVSIDVVKIMFSSLRVWRMWSFRTKSNL